jgi:ornithine cyclodeaminase/alanine dehydrogenase-like protein (mu-crystallin family)
LKEQDVVELADMPSVVAALRTAFLAQAHGEAVNIPRVRFAFEGRRLNVMAGGTKVPSRYALKSYGSSSYHVLLYAAEQGVLAIIEADALGQIRTGAASGLATECMARRDAGKVALIGTGRQARTQLHALKAVGRLHQVAVAARNRDKLDAFCERLARELDVPVRAAATPEQAVRGADIVVTATNSSQPVVLNEWLSPGAHVNAMGANAAERREIDAEIVLRAALVVTDDIAQAKLEAGEFIDLAKAGRLDWSVVKPLHQIVAAPSLARADDAVTLFKSLGVGLEDVAIASLLYDRAIASGRHPPL